MLRDRSTRLWASVGAGRALALVAIIAIALNLRTAVASVSPIVDQIAIDIPLSSVGLGLIGMLPPVLFAIIGFVSPVIARRIGLEASLVLALVIMVAGHIARSLSPGFTALFVGTAVGLIGMGMGNVLLPPIVKRYFPDRVGLLTAVYAMLLSLSTALPALLAVPLADSLGWRFSLGVWAALAGVALVPWILLLAQHRRTLAAAETSPELDTPAPQVSTRLWRSPIALAIALVLGMSSLNVYAIFAWLPEILRDIAGVSAAEAGTLLAIFGLAGFPAAILAPVLLRRLRNPGWSVYSGVASSTVGYTGLLLTPATLTWLWVLLIGLGAILFPIALALINRRTTTALNSAALSGFAQGIGYTVAALGPLVVGVLHDTTGGWTAPIVFLLVTVLAALVGGYVVGRPGTVEDELARSRARRR